MIISNLDKNNILNFLKNNLDIIKKNYISSNLAWQNFIIIPNKLPKCFYCIVEEDNGDNIELLLLDVWNKSPKNIIPALPFAYKDNNIWKLNDLCKSECDNICNLCDNYINIGDYRCAICEDFDLCLKCYNMHKNNKSDYGILYNHNHGNKYKNNLKKIYCGYWGYNTYDWIDIVYQIDLDNLNIDNIVEIVH